MRILVVEDEQEISVAVGDGLRSAGFAVDLAGRLSEADEKLCVYVYDCLVVDRGLPDGDGLVFVATRRAAGMRVPVLVLTAMDAVADRLVGFENGADDYLVKPFAMAELAARVGALCRRAEQPRPVRLRVADLDVDMARRRVCRSGVLLTLTAKEFLVLATLTSRPGRIVSRTELIERCWDEMSDPLSNVVDAVITRLRRKLGEPGLVRTVRGAGYLIDG